MVCLMQCITDMYLDPFFQSEDRLKINLRYPYPEDRIFNPSSLYTHFNTLKEKTLETNCGER